MHLTNFVYVANSPESDICVALPTEISTTVSAVQLVSSVGFKSSLQNDTTSFKQLSHYELMAALTSVVIY